MSQIPAELIRKIDQLLWIKGRPYRRFVGGMWKDTPCYQWTTKINPMEAATMMSPELQQAMIEIQKQIARRPYLDLATDPMKYMRRRFFRQFPDLIVEYDGYISRLDEANRLYMNPSGLKPPELPEALREPAERISQQINLEYGASDFNMDSYLQRLKELWDEQPEDIRAMQKEFQQKITKYEEAYQNAAEQKKDRLQLVRAHIRVQPYLAYGDVVVAPTDNQYDILRIEETNGANYDLRTEDIIEALRGIDNQFEIDILNATYDSVRFKLKKPPSGKHAEKLIEQLYTLCPDLEGEEKPEMDDPILLWWD